jgi:hypothetical protein
MITPTPETGQVASAETADLPLAPGSSPPESRALPDNALLQLCEFELRIVQ